MLRNAWLIVIGVLFCSSVYASSCKQPTTECLRQHIQSQIEQLQKQGLNLHPTTIQHWQFEHSSLSKKPVTFDNDLQKQLLDEESFIQLIRQGKTATAYTKSNTMPLPFHDLLHAQAAHLIVQQLTLSLKDAEAEQLKRALLEASWQQGETPNRELIEIARHEILGGNPKKGLATLSNTEINEFSDIDLLNELTNVEQLGRAAETLFLDPTAAKKRCDQDTGNALGSLQEFLSTHHLTQTASLWNTPNILQAWKAHLTQIMLYENADSCELLVSLQRHQLIQSALYYQAKSEQDLLDLVFLLRALRRYNK
ncbi:MAG: hypothetical protein D9N11_07885 [Ketobacter sp.]|nr:MAG: hypothetical protein D9N11_07885 [Ketobacter sp.]